ncbi:hypothetical protein SDC9_149108 [bioreactor metagenome]|uniref:Uncharacterized protein n=1 Tax=bioreactor metagenome TaxID=1076179 RepID=A0A645EIQ0_9ZZZZ
MLHDFGFLHSFHPQTVLHAEEINSPQNESHAQQEIKQFSPCGVIPRRTDVNVQRVSLFGRISVGINLADVQHITARVEVVVGNPVAIWIKQMPTGIDPFQLVNKLILLFE